MKAVVSPELDWKEQEGMGMGQGRPRSEPQEKWPRGGMCPERITKGYCPLREAGAHFRGSDTLPGQGHLLPKKPSWLLAETTVGDDDDGF